MQRHADPWLSQRMVQYAFIRRAEVALKPAITDAVADYLTATRTALPRALTGRAGGAFATGPEADPPGLPPASAWARAVDRYVKGPARSVWRGSFGRITGRDAPEDDAGYTAGLHDRLAGFRQQVADRLRAALHLGRQQGETPAQLRTRVEALLALENWDGQIMTMTRTETMCALNAGAFHGALTEQERTGQPWQKSWLATHDMRVRHTHHEADRQARPLHDPFHVGDATLQFPGDPLGPPGEVINCRCAAMYGPADAPLTAAAAAFHGTVGQPSYVKYHPSGGRRRGKTRTPGGGLLGSDRFTETQHEEAMLDYTGRAYRDMNSWLRTRTPPVRATEEQTRQAVYALNDLITVQEPTTSATVLYRGTRQLQLGLNPGDEFHDKGFASASAEEDLPRAFTGVGGSLFRIHAPAGTQMLDVAGVGGDRSEHEYILPPGTKYRVTQVRDPGDPLKTTEYDLEIIRG